MTIFQSAGRKSAQPKRRGTLPPGLSGTDMAFQIAAHPEHETGDVPRGRTRRRAPTDSHGLNLPAIPQWHRDAACALLPEFATVDFFRDHAKARQACDQCIVRLDCLEDALTHECEVRLCYGVRGGLNAKERLTLIRQGETRGTIYFGFRDGLIKIGCTRGDVRFRVAKHAIDLLATEPGLFTRERELHKRFAPLLVRGREWFKPGPDLIGYIAALPDARVQAIEVAA